MKHLTNEEYIKILENYIKDIHELTIQDSGWAALIMSFVPGDGNNKDMGGIALVGRAGKLKQVLKHAMLKDEKVFRVFTEATEEVCKQKILEDLNSLK